MRVGLVSLDQEWEDKAENLTRCRALARRAAALEAQLIVFPEMTLTGFTMSVASVAEHPADSSTIRAFSALARELRVALAFGVVLHGAERPANSMIVVAPDGAELARYAKLHPFSLAHENAHYEAGSSLATALVHDVACGLSICCYVVAVNRTGTDGNGIHFPSARRSSIRAASASFPMPWTATSSCSRSMRVRSRLTGAPFPRSATAVPCSTRSCAPAPPRAHSGGRSCRVRFRSSGRWFRRWETDRLQRRRVPTSIERRFSMGAIGRATPGWQEAVGPSPGPSSASRR